MSVMCRFPLALLQQIQNDLATLTHTVQTLQTTTDNSLILTLQSTVDSIAAVLSSTQTSINNVFLHPTFTECTVGTLNYLDDFGIPHNLENTLDSKLIVASRVTPAYYANNRKITLGCDVANTAYVHFNSNDTNTTNTSFDCKLV